ncbi:hypothetical protein [Anaeromyxobacter sp. PSR-1]|uniref:hypothetical protein n=1 Tax=Anaeromyxobacter sp. PSR-1 TaxID=1300915 RepID=UPI00126A62A3|nr:hypothetical protein [Anaeromyxobacter sp. PSR-1]
MGVPSAWRKQLPSSVKGRDLALALVRFFEPDVFVEAENGLADKLGIRGDAHSFRRRVIPLAEFHSDTEGTGADFLLGQDVFELYQYRYKRELRFVPKHNDRKFAYVEKGDPRRAIFEASVGVFPNEKAVEYFRRGYGEAFEPETLEATAASYLKILEGKYATPFHVGSHGIETNYRDGWDPTVFVFDSSSVPDLIDYWNVALFKRVVPLDIAWFGTAIEFLRAFIERTHRPLPGNPHGVMIHTTLEFGRSISEKTARDAIDLLTDSGQRPLPQHSFSIKLWYDQIWHTDWRHGGVQPRLARLEAAEDDIEPTVSIDNPNFQFKPLAPKFARRFGRGTNHARWANVLTLNDYSGESGLAITYPPNVVATDVPRLTISEPTIVSREGFVLLQQMRHGREFISLQPQKTAFITWFESRGLKAKPSDPGRNADEVIRAVGGLRACSIFADAPTLELMERMAKSVHERKSGTVEEFPDRTAGVAQWKQILDRRKSGGKAWSAPGLSAFTDRNVIRLGLSVRCPKCGQNNWYDLSTVDYEVACQRCLRSFPFPQGNLSFKEKDWRYRLVGPFSHANHAMGAYSTVLSLRALGATLHVGHEVLTYSTGLLLESDTLGPNPLEVDFVAWYRAGEKFWINPAPSLVFGESKSFGSKAFDRRSIQRLKRLAELFPGCFLVFSTLKESLAPEETKLIRSLAQWGRGLRNGEHRALVIVLTATELFSEWHVPQTWKAKGGKHAALTAHPSTHMDDLWELASLTQQVYLDMGSYDSELIDRFKRKQRRH